VVTISTDKLIENPETKKIYGSSDDSTLKLSISPQFHSKNTLNPCIYRGFHFSVKTFVKTF
jgi:hypothetical protein